MVASICLIEGRPAKQSLSSTQTEVLLQLLPTLSEEKRLVVQSILHDFGS